MNDTIAVVLGGGAGTRLHPLTSQRSKPAVPLAGKYRLIDVPVSNCLNSGITRIFVLTQYNSASLNRHIARAYRFDRFRHGFVTILAAEQTPTSLDWFQGTADAVRKSMLHVQTYRHKYILVLSGDQLYTMDYRRMLRHHQESGAEITIATIPVTADEAPGFGILKTADDGTITEFFEKPPRDALDGKESAVSDEMEASGRHYLASMGIYVFNADTMRQVLEERPDAHDFGKEIIPDAIGARRVTSYAFEGYWSDIGTIRSFYDANLMLAQPKPAFDLYNPEMPLYTNARMLPPAKIQNSTVVNSIIAEASVVVDSTITGSVIGLRAFIGRNTVIKDSIIMGADYYPWYESEQRDSALGPERPGVGEGSHVEGAIVDRNASIGFNCEIRNADGIEEAERDSFYIRDGIVVVPKNAHIPDGTKI